jgi:hypothetical protein
MFSQRAVRLKIVEIYCDFCCEDLVFSKVCFDNFFVQQFNKRRFDILYIYRILLMLNSHCILACFGSISMTFKVALKYPRVNCTFLQGNYDDTLKHEFAP